MSFEQSARSAKSPPLTYANNVDAPTRGATRHRGWVGGYGTGGDVSGDGNAQGFNYGFGGGTFGVDRYVGGNTVVGLAGGYAASHLRTDSLLQSSQVGSFQTALYASRVVERRYLLGIASYGYDSYRSARQLPGNLTARGDYDGHQIGTYGEAGLLRRWGAWNWQPSLGLQYISLRQDAFTETGAGGAGLAVDGHTDDSFRGILGLRFARPTQFAGLVLTPDVHTRYGYEFLDVDRFVTANFAGVVGNGFTTAGNQLGRSFGQYGIGLNALITRRFGTYLGYDVLATNRSVSHMGSGGLQLSW